MPREKIIYIPAIYIDLDIFKPLNVAKDDLIFVGRLAENKRYKFIRMRLKNLMPKQLLSAMAH